MPKSRTSEVPEWAKVYNAHLEALMRAAGIADRAELARISDISESQFSIWKSGRYRPSQNNLRKLVKAFNEVAPTLDVTLTSLEIAAGRVSPGERGLDAAPPTTILPRQFTELHERWATAVESDPGFADEILRHVQMVNEWAAGQDVLRERDRQRAGKS